MKASICALAAALIGFAPNAFAGEDDPKKEKGDVVYSFQVPGFGWSVPSASIREIVAKNVDVASKVLCDSSATVTIYAKKADAKLAKEQIEGIFKGAKKRWKVADFRREERKKAKAGYMLTFAAGSTWQNTCSKIRGVFADTKKFVDVQVDAKSKTVTLLAADTGMTEEKLMKLIDGKGVKVTKFASIKDKKIL